MKSPKKKKSQFDKVRDADDQNWVDLFFPSWTVPYLRLSRADRPAGTWLLLIPCWWGILLAANEKNNFGLVMSDFWLLIACTIGAFLMRGAGCTWNDILDKDFDKLVERTRSRPIPAGQITVIEAIIWMVIQALCAFMILLTFNKISILIAISSLILVAIYPLSKRFTWWPQLFLGLTFNWGILVGYSASKNQISLAALILYAAGISWTLFYDTIYAFQDLKDDIIAGVKSTARLFGKSTKIWLTVFLLIFWFLAGIAILLSSLNGNMSKIIVSTIGICLLLAHLFTQLVKLDITSENSCMKTFQSNRNAGLILVTTLFTTCFL